MLTKKKLLLVSSFVILATANVSIANDAVSSDMISATTVETKAAEGSLKLVMQGLLKSTQQLTAAMLKEDFTLIAANAKVIADHPKPSMATRMKIMKAMGSDMVKFKVNDDIVHSAATNIMTNAEQKNINGVGEHFKKMIGGCLSCHSAFKNRVSDILK